MLDHWDWKRCICEKPRTCATFQVYCLLAEAISFSDEIEVFVTAT